MKSKELLNQLTAAKVEMDALVSLQFGIELFATCGFEDYSYEHGGKMYRGKVLHGRELPSHARTVRQRHLDGLLTVQELMAALERMSSDVDVMYQDDRWLGGPHSVKGFTLHERTFKGGNRKQIVRLDSSNWENNSTMNLPLSKWYRITYIERETRDNRTYLREEFIGYVKDLSEVENAIRNSLEVCPMHPQDCRMREVRNFEVKECYLVDCPDGWKRFYRYEQ